jgi:enoyl-CoA hydratase/carnithine racemase
MEYATILTSEDDGVATVTLNRPERLNAGNARMLPEFRHAVAAFDARDDISAIIITGAGRGFCAGADMEPGQQNFTHDPGVSAGGDETLAELEERYKPVSDLQFWQMGTPIIAAVNGVAVGWGLTMAIQCDFRIMADNAKFGFVFTRRSLVPEFGCSWYLPRLVGSARALDLLITGRFFYGAEALSMGLATEVHPADQVLTRANEIARDIATNVGPLAAAMTKRLVLSGLEETDRTVHQKFENDNFSWLVQSPDALEGMMSFMEKRDPHWAMGKNSDFPSQLWPEGDK